jgi:5-methylcytosine-specific restriction protein B
MRAWKGLGRPDQARLISDPWAFAAWLDAVPTSKNRQLREILLYLLFPDSFERMATGRDKEAAVRSFLEQEKKDPDSFSYDNRVLLDKEVKRIREEWAPRLGGDEFDFYRKPARLSWLQRTSAPVAGGQDSPPNNADEDAAQKWFDKTFGDRGVWMIAAGSGGVGGPTSARKA